MESSFLHSWALPDTSRQLFLMVASLCHCCVTLCHEAAASQGKGWGQPWVEAPALSVHCVCVSGGIQSRHLLSHRWIIFLVGIFLSCSGPADFGPFWAFQNSFCSSSEGLRHPYETTPWRLFCSAGRAACVLSRLFCAITCLNCMC